MRIEEIKREIETRLGGAWTDSALCIVGSCGNCGTELVMEGDPAEIVDILFEAIDKAGFEVRRKDG